MTPPPGGIQSCEILLMSHKHITSRDPPTLA